MTQLLHYVIFCQALLLHDVRPIPTIRLLIYGKLSQAIDLMVGRIGFEHMTIGLKVSH